MGSEDQSYIQTSVNEFLTPAVQGLIFGTFVFISLVFFGILYGILVTQFDLPLPVEIEIRDPYGGGRYFLIGFSITLAYVVLVEYSTNFREFATKGPNWLWNLITFEDLDELSIPEEKEFQKMQQQYSKVLLNHVPLILISITIPIAISQTYLRQVNLQIVGAIYLVFGIIMGASESAFLKQSIESTTEKSMYKKAYRTVAAQIEVLFLFTAAVFQASSAIGLSTNKLIGTAILFVFGVLVFAVPLFVKEHYLN
ncbi:hypothetical protein [Haloferax prahovense]|uniref:hypothetical protein n=1 Tax=Haloferax prahovense TaxID=381852 RepID=UPI0006791F76|nr:hypothetical protein [Haloferax prahovense]